MDSQDSLRNQRTRFGPGAFGKCQTWPFQRTRFLRGRYFFAKVVFGPHKLQAWAFGQSQTIPLYILYFKTPQNFVFYTSGSKTWTARLRFWTSTVATLLYLLIYTCCWWISQKCVKQIHGIWTHPKYVFYNMWIFTHPSIPHTYLLHLYSRTSKRPLRWSIHTPININLSYIN